MPTAPLIDQPHAAPAGIDPRDAALAALVHACERHEPMSSEELRAWQARMGLSGRAAARLLGMNTTTYLDRANGKSYTTGLPVPVPRTLMLACIAPEVAHMTRNSQKLTDEKRRGPGRPRSSAAGTPCPL